MAQEKEFLTLLLTTGVITTLISSLINIGLTYTTNKNVQAVEKLKRSYQIDFMRFEKINEIRIEIDKYLIFTPFDVIKAKESSEELGSVYQKMISDAEELIELYEANSPYFDPDLRENIETSKKVYINQRELLQGLIYSLEQVSDKEKFDKELPKLFESGVQFKDDLENNIQTQMKRLDITDQ